MQHKHEREARVTRALLVTGLVLAMLLVSGSAFALPRMSLTAGTPCSACHVNLQGGGMRTDIGWGSLAYTGAFVPESFEEQETNTFLEETVAVGGDIRLQVARLGRPSRNAANEVVTPDRSFIPMQIQPYLSISPTESGWLKLYGTYNIGPGLIQDGELCKPRYNGQSCFEAQVIVQPHAKAPTFRVGQLQPSIGVRHDDHTMMIRGDAAGAPIIAPNYADLGAEATYTPAHWFQADLGGFYGRNLAEAIADDAVIAEDGAPTVSGRVQFLPRLSDKFVSWAGASILASGKFNLQNYFVGLGWLNHGSLMLEASRSSRGADADHKTFNMMAAVNYQFKEWIVAEARVERATTSKQGQDFQKDAVVAGLQFFPVPYLELRPEYRAVWGRDYKMGQYTLQVHMFY